MSHINSKAPLRYEAPREKNLKKYRALRNAFILGALRNVFMESERHVVSRIMVGPSLELRLIFNMIFQKTIPNHLILLTYFFCWNFEQTLKNV